MSQFINPIEDETNRLKSDFSNDPANKFLRTMYKNARDPKQEALDNVEGLDSTPFDAIAEALKLARSTVRKRMQAGEGRNDTIKTIGLGEIPSANLERKFLLGY